MARGCGCAGHVGERIDPALTTQKEAEPAHKPPGATERAFARQHPQTDLGGLRKPLRGLVPDTRPHLYQRTSGPRTKILARGIYL